MSKRVNRCSPLTLLRDRTAAERPRRLPAVTRSKSHPTPFVLQPLLVVPARGSCSIRPGQPILARSEETTRVVEHAVLDALGWPPPAR